MTHATNQPPGVTIVVVPRERFGATQRNLESLYAHTQIPFELVYIDGGSPQPVQRYLEAQSQARGFRLLRVDHFLSPNQARNLGWQAVNTEYLVFVDNDVVVTPGWLTQLVNCAEETDAAIVGPLTCIGKPIHGIVHNPGGNTFFKEEQVGDQLVRRFHHKSHFNNKPLDKVREHLQRTECDYVEFHCMLVRTSTFEQTGPLDEGLLSIGEHLDFCLLAKQAGGRVFAEREAIVTYVPEPPNRPADVAYFMLRWSDAWDTASLKHFAKKWDLTEDKYFKKRYDRVGYRRHRAYIRPLVNQLTFGIRSHKLEQLFVRLDHQLNRYVTRWFDRKHPQHGHTRQRTVVKPLASTPAIAATDSKPTASV